MQVPGTPCGICGERIVSTLNGVSCLDCEKAYHKACLQNPAACPKCGRSFIDAHADRWARKEDAADRTQIRGRVFAWWGLLLILGAEAVVLGATSIFPISGHPKLYAPLGLQLVAAGYLIRGHEWARWAFFVLAILCALSTAALCVRTAESHGLLAAWVLGALSAMVVAGLALLACPSVGVFLTDRRRISERSGDSA